MGFNLSDQGTEESDNSFLEGLFDFLNSNQGKLSEVMNPETAFNVSDTNKNRIKELLVNLQKEKLIEQEFSQESTDEANIERGRYLVKNVIEIFTNLLFEALQFVNILPNMLVEELKQEADELKNVAGAFESIKNNLIDFKNLVRW